nr:MAG TPA: hypothetical protein [Caudoviricetes sp.]
MVSLLENISQRLIDLTVRSLVALHSSWRL